MARHCGQPVMHSSSKPAGRAGRAKEQGQVSFWAVRCARAVSVEDHRTDRLGSRALRACLAQGVRPRAIDGKLRHACEGTREKPACGHSRIFKRERIGVVDGGGDAAKRELQIGHLETE